MSSSRSLTSWCSWPDVKDEPGAEVSRLGSESSGGRDVVWRRQRREGVHQSRTRLGLQGLFCLNELGFSSLGNREPLKLTEWESPCSRAGL